MIRYFFIVFFSLIYSNLISQVFDTQILMNNGNTDKRINFVYMGDGYIASRQGPFITDAINAMNTQFNFTPYKEYKNFFNVFAIKVISNESGTDHPGTATDVTEPVFPITEADTYFDSTFDYYNIHRLLVPTNYTAIFDVLTTNTPFYDQANIIVNSPYYGGSGGAFATCSTNSQANLIMIHEIGHSFVNLADEYWAGTTYALEKANMTQEDNPSLVKWKNWIGDEAIGTYAYGTNSPQSNWFRPHQYCMMRQLNGQFCAVCREATIDRIYSLVNPIENFSPIDTNITFLGDDINFSIDVIHPDPNTLSIKWKLDDTIINTTDENIVLTNEIIGSEPHVLTVTLEDITDLSRTYTFANGYVFSVTWNINNTLEINEEGIQKFLFKIYPNPAQEQLIFSYNAQNVQGKYKLSINSINGKILQEKIVVPQEGVNEIIFDINNLESGIYIINIKSSYYTKSFKFFKE